MLGGAIKPIKAPTCTNGNLLMWLECKDGSVYDPANNGPISTLPTSYTMYTRVLDARGTIGLDEHIRRFQFCILLAKQSSSAGTKA